MKETVINPLKMAHLLHSNSNGKKCECKMTIREGINGIGIHPMTNREAIRLITTPIIVGIRGKTYRDTSGSLHLQGCKISER